MLSRLLIIASLAIVNACASRPFGEVSSEDFPVVNVRGKNALLDNARISTLFNDVTAYGWYYPGNTTFIRYYGKAGRVIELHTVKGRREGNWRVHSDQLCVNWNGQQECSVIKRENNRIGQYQISATGKLNRIIGYERFLRGNLERLE
ncbi:MAG: hypothetical protein PVF52_05050 [Granulosicoccaceae bacterium]|jgi:hypothetical protein